MVTATTELASAERDSLVLIAQFNLAPMIACQEDLVLTTHAFAQLVGLTSTVQSSCAPMIATEMVIARMAAVFAVLTSLDLSARHQFVSEVAVATACA